MGKFAIACPQCNSYVTAYNGLRGLVQNKVTCGACGYEIDVKSERMTTVKCQSCQNVVVYDQGKGTPTCPVCKQKIMLTPDTYGSKEVSKVKILRFKCPECGMGISLSNAEAAEMGISLSASEAAAEAKSSSKTLYTCPICDHQIDVRRELAKDQYSKENLASIIEYKGDNDTIVYKHPIENFNTGSKLIVQESQEAIFFRDGQALDSFRGNSFILETSSLPLMDEHFKLPTGDMRETFHSHIYFINLATIMNINWGTDSRVRLPDPGTGMQISVGMSGHYNVRVSDTRRLLYNIVGTTTEFRKQDLKEKVASILQMNIKSNLAGIVKREQISIFEIDARLKDIAVALCESINIDLERYGLMITEFLVEHVVTPEDDENDPAHDDYMRMKALFGKEAVGVKEQEVATTITRAEGERRVVEQVVQKEVAEAAQEAMLVEAQTSAKLDVIKAQVEAEKVRLEAQAKAEGYRMQAEAEAQEMKMKGYSYQQETSRQVGLQAMQNGITGGEGGSGASALGDLASLGISLGAMGSVIGMTRDAIQPVTEGATQIGQTFGGQITGNQTVGTNPVAGSQPQPRSESQKADVWTCPECGMKDITSKHCPECGAKRPEPKKPATWICPECGMKDITSKHCPECGCKRPEVQKPVAWTCPECGTTDITSKCCPECGHKREE